MFPCYMRKYSIPRGEISQYSWVGQLTMGQICVTSLLINFDNPLMKQNKLLLLFCC